MDESQRLKLQSMIKANNTEDYTSVIRDINHSNPIRQDVNNLILLKAKYRGDPDRVHLEAMHECHFLYDCYTDIYNKVLKDELDLMILLQLLDTLEKIENGVFDQHEASFSVGTLLKELYVDSALKKADKLNEANKDSKPTKEVRCISWSQYQKIKHVK